MNPVGTFSAIAVKILAGRILRIARDTLRGVSDNKEAGLTVSGLHALLWEATERRAFIVWRETAKKRLVAKLKAIKLELKHRRHEPIASVGAWLQKVTSGYYQYHAVPSLLQASPIASMLALFARGHLGCAYLLKGDGRRLRTEADYHDHEADPVFVPAPHPADLPITEAGAERHRGPQT